MHMQIKTTDKIFEQITILLNILLISLLQLIYNNYINARQVYPDHSFHVDHPRLITLATEEGTVPC